MIIFEVSGVMALWGAGLSFDPGGAWPPVLRVSVVYHEPRSVLKYAEPSRPFWGYSFDMFGYLLVLGAIVKCGVEFDYVVRGRLLRDIAALPEGALVL